jgi:hypothetical protein
LYDTLPDDEVEEIAEDDGEDDGGMGTDEAIIYSYDIATVSSIIPAFANRKDVLIVDEVGWDKRKWVCVFASRNM